MNVCSYCVEVSTIDCGAERYFRRVNVSKSFLHEDRTNITSLQANHNRCTETKDYVSTILANWCYTKTSPRIHSLKIIKKYINIFEISIIAIFFFAFLTLCRFTALEVNFCARAIQRAPSKKDRRYGWTPEECLIFVKRTAPALFILLFRASRVVKKKYI